MRPFLFFCFLVLVQKLPGQVTPVNFDTPITKKNQRINFKPTVFHRKFSSRSLPVLKIYPGDTVSTESVDAGGYDKTGTRITERGNPLTGPFYIEGAAPGDVIAVTILKLSLNRNYATTLEAFVPRSLSKKIIKKTWRSAKLVKWNLDLKNKIGTPVIVHEHLQGLKVPLKPFLGCIGVAPPGEKGISTSDSGPYGGNLDFQYITESATIFLPVFHNGALVFMGDGHAVQGDGELNGDALETSMDFEFTVRIVKNENLKMQYPRVEDTGYIMTFGIDKTLDDALKIATEGLLHWLQEDYHLSLQEASQVIGPSIKYSIPKIAATKVEVVAMIKKDILKGLKKYDLFAVKYKNLIQSIFKDNYGRAEYIPFFFK